MYFVSFLKHVLPWIPLIILIVCMEFALRSRWGQRLKSALIGPKEKSESTTSTQMSILQRQLESSQARRDEEHRVNEYYRARMGAMTKEIQKLNEAVIKRNRTINGLRKGRKEYTGNPRVL